MSSVVVVSVWGSQTGAEDETYDFKIGEAPRKHVHGWVHVSFPDSEARELLGRQVCEHTCMKPTDKLLSGLWPSLASNGFRWKCRCREAEKETSYYSKRRKLGISAM